MKPLRPRRQSTNDEAADCHQSLDPGLVGSGAAGRAPLISPAPRSVTEEEQRFWSKVKKAAPGECWEWTGSLNASGYGSFAVEGNGHNASRIAKMLTSGPIPEGLCVCHSCDNPACCNPAHLWIGTYKQNRDDAITKGRMKEISGSNNPRGYIEAPTVLAIKAAAAKGWRHVAIAEHFGVSRPAVSNILAGRRGAGPTEALNA